MNKTVKYISAILIISICLAAMSSCVIRKVEDTDNTPSETTAFNAEAENDTTKEPDGTSAEATDTESNSSAEPPTDAPETDAPVTDAPETDTPVTDTPETDAPETDAPQTEPPVTDAPQTEPPVTDAPQTEPPETDAPKPPAVTTGDCLFIGDSRTVGLQLYSGMDVDYFASVGMSIYNMESTSVEVEGIGQTTLESLLSQRQYKRIFIMLGINEIGYPHAATAARFKAAVDTIKTKQPGATVFIQANIHVSKERSDKGDSINNANLNSYNAELKKLADNQRVFFLDANFLFDDASGNLSSEKTSDGVHFYSKDYIPWAKWLLEESEKLMK